MITIFTHSDLPGLSLMRREDFGPRSANPFLALDLDGTGQDFAAFLTNLPCPVIGIGNGGLASACDCLVSERAALERITKNIINAPITAMVLVQHLRMSETLDLADALIAESFAYSTVQKGPEFHNWLATYCPLKIDTDAPPQLHQNIDNNTLSLILDDPASRNGIGVTLRDALCEAFDLALLDKTIERVTLTGKGRTFSTGGMVEEFGVTTDPATAHWVRSLRLPAQRLVNLRDRFSVHVNGAAIGAGVEIAAFAKYVTATPKAWFQLPELKYGLIPGAGGTVSVTRRIGRQKTAYMALSMDKISAAKALDWGLIDAII